MNNQIELDFLRQVKARAEKERPGFTEAAADFILRYLRHHGQMPGEMLTDLARAAGHAPSDSRAFGPVFKMLLARRQIRQVGWTLRRKGHGTAGGRVWEAVQ